MQERRTFCQTRLQIANKAFCEKEISLQQFFASADGVVEETEIQTRLDVTNSSSQSFLETAARTLSSLQTQLSSAVLQLVREGRQELFSKADDSEAEMRQRLDELRDSLKK